MDALSTLSDFEAFVRAHQARALRIGVRLAFGDAAAAQDAVQEAFLRLWRCREQLEASNLEAYLYRTVLSCARDANRRLRPTVPLDEKLALSPRHESPDTGLMVRDALAQLPDDQREVVILSHYEGWTQAEIAELLQIPPGTVASRLHHALRKLRVLLTDAEDQTHA
ncbi:RNA polymerase sigma factor [Armatimonas rosea]|uniref:RNA polymerase sigma-70 factor (ECF subfamily) n=1 Tax=Armatimonas rosea TaxID=685828 RepID=A0A7W9SVH1_ARMRO|nr:RNA polymerase sigma factor [Armatimonas rosea]MBB6053095.1 RNA polymerase sigma-70 factor (ECF subfamily) [Armatimonas rosea]